LDGKPVSLSDYIGQVVLVNNWAFWCPPCRAELPALEAYYEDQKENGFVVVAIEAGDEVDDVAYHVDLYQLSFPVWMDPETRALRVFKNTGLPNSYLIDRQGIVRLTWNGPINRELLDKYVTTIIEEQIND
jgi:thiol-disulfide isomerase/thioredoxin